MDVVSLRMTVIKLKKSVEDLNFGSEPNNILYEIIIIIIIERKKR